MVKRTSNSSIAGSLFAGSSIAGSSVASSSIAGFSIPAFSVIACSIMAGLLLATIAGCSRSPSDAPVLDAPSSGARSSIESITDSTVDQQVVDSDNSELFKPESAELPVVDLLSDSVVDKKQIKTTAQSLPAVTAAMSGTGRLRTLQSVSAVEVMPFPLQPQQNTENYTPFDDNPVKQVAVAPVSTFSIDVDTAAYSNIRRMIAREGRLPPGHAVRIEEMINYFSYQYPQPTSDSQPFAIATELAPAPWNQQRQLLRIGLQGYGPPSAQRPAANLVFLVDVSGSMQSADKLPLLKKALRLLVNQLSEDDRIALVVYAGAAGVVLEPTSGASKSTIMTAIDGLQAGGSTHGSAGIRLAYALAREHFIDGGINRVLVASDGDMNVGTVSIDALVELIERERKSGIQLSTLGFGTGNYNYALMEQLADNGNGTASYIDSIREAHKVLVSELQSTLLTIARDVKVQIEFNPALVTEYRLIGYENRMLASEDFRNDKVDAGDIGAGHSVTALYELTLRGSDAERIDPLRYQSVTSSGDHVIKGVSTGYAVDDTLPSEAELAHIKLRYKRPGEAQSRQIKHSILSDAITHDFENASEDFRFVSAVAAFGQYLRGGKYNDAITLGDMVSILRKARGVDSHGYRSEFISLVELASALMPAGGNADSTDRVNQRPLMDNQGNSSRGGNAGTHMSGDGG